MNKELILSVTENDEFKKNITALTTVYSLTEKKIIEEGILTYISQTVRPLYKNYRSESMTGVSPARMMKGVDSKRNYVESQVGKIVDTYGLENINDDVFNTAMDLVIITLDAIFDSGSKNLKKKYEKALNDPEFLYFNLHLSVKIIGEELLKNEVSFKNKTLEYVTKYIVQHKKEVSEIFRTAYSTDDFDDVMRAKQDYHERMQKILAGILNDLSVPYRDIEKIGRESKIVEVLGVDILENVLLIQINRLKEQLLRNNNIQRLLFE